MAQIFFHKSYKTYILRFEKGGLKVSRSILKPFGKCYFPRVWPNMAISFMAISPPVNYIRLASNFTIVFILSKATPKTTGKTIGRGRGNWHTLLFIAVVEWLLVVD